MRMRGKSRKQLTVRYTCKAYSGMYHVHVLVNVNVPENAMLEVPGTFTSNLASPPSATQEHPATTTKTATRSSSR
jgi:hypothetical protein